MKRLEALGLLNDATSTPRSLVEACHDEQLVGGVSLSLRATPDEVLGPLTFAMGGVAAKVKLLDVLRAGAALTLELRVEGAEERWKVRDVEDLIEQLGERFLDDDDVKQLVVLGEFEGMLQVWAVRPDVLEVLLHTRLLDAARNLGTLREFFEL